MSTEPQIAASHRKLRPNVAMPEAAVLRALSPGQRQVLEQCLSEPAECILDARFQLPTAQAEILVPLESLLAKQVQRRISRGGNDDSGLDLLADDRPALEPTIEQKLFLRYNYCRYLVMRILREYRGRALDRQATSELLRWESEVLRMRCEIVRANLPLVLAMAKRTRITGVDYAELISEGNLALLRSVDKFDCSRGYKFSTYACRAILKSFSRVATRTSRYRGYFPTEFDPTLEKGNLATHRRATAEDEWVDELKHILAGNSANLNEIERTVIKARFAIDAQPDPGEPTRAKTLEQVGEMIGVTKERVRQIQNKALEKLRVALEGGVLAV